MRKLFLAFALAVSALLTVGVTALAGGGTGCC